MAVERQTLYYTHVSQAEIPETKARRNLKCLHSRCKVHFVLSFMQVFHVRNITDLLIWCHFLTITASVPVLSMLLFRSIYVEIESGSALYVESVREALPQLQRHGRGGSGARRLLPARGAGHRENGWTGFHQEVHSVCMWALLVLWNPRASAKMYCLMFSAFQRFSKQKGLSWASCYDHDRSKTPLRINLKPLTSQLSNFNISGHSVKCTLAFLLKEFSVYLDGKIKVGFYIYRLLVSC